MASTQRCNKKFIDLKHLEAVLADVYIANRLYLAGNCKPFLRTGLDCATVTLPIAVRIATVSLHFQYAVDLA